MQAENALTWILIGYSLAMTMVLIVLAGRNSQPAVVVQQTPTRDDSLSGCGLMLLLAVLIVIGLAIFGALGA